MTERVQDKHVIAVWMDAGLSRKRAASRLGITVNMLTKRARKLDLPMREQGKKKFPDKQIRLVWGDASLTRKQAAGTVGMSVSALTDRARALSLPMRRKVGDKRIPAARIREVWLDPHLTGAQAAKKVGLTRTNLWLRAKALGLEPRKQGTRFLIIGDEAIALFKAMWEAKVPALDMAAYFDIHYMTVSAYARRWSLSSRSHHPRLISLDRFWVIWNELLLRDQMKITAVIDNAAQGRMMQAVED